MKHLLGLSLIFSFLSFKSIAQQPAREVAVAYNKTTMLVFPSKIIDADWGTEDVSIRIAKKTPTVLKVKATTTRFSPTNITIYTEDGLMYMATVHYDSMSENKPYLFNAMSEGYPVKQVINGRQEQTMQDVKNLAASLAAATPRLHHPFVKVAKTKLSLGNLWIKDDLLYFQLHLDNPSPIPFDIAITKYYERDNTKAKRTTVVEKEVTPYYERFNESRRIASGAAGNFIIVFSKFTIADSKHFAIELFEKDGDRHLVLNIKGKKILAASLLP